MRKPQIKILPEDLINKIAAGEVIERPASVVKELVENSIDAGASQIVVEIQKAGKKLIKVLDNGCGMTQEEITIALQRHSTSKISSLEDLYNIKTLGFRGEALPSIASVSKLKIEPNPSGQGITVEVKDLFYNTPVRKKFLKTDATELGHIGDIISKYVIAYPEISFKFISDGKPLLISTGSGKLLEAIIAVFGSELAKELIEVNLDFDKGKIYGFVSRPTLTRVDKSYEIFYVNRRYIRNFFLNRALEEAYRSLIPNNRYPVGIIFMEIDPKEVDVNVHPTKREVKFLRTQEIMEVIIKSTKTALSKPIESHQFNVGFIESSSSIPEKGEWKPGMAEVFFPELSKGSIQYSYPVYQLKNTYLVTTDGEDLILIDQHAAHERIIYDQLSKKKIINNKQPLLIPETIEFPPKESLILQENLEYLRHLDFDIEEFGNNSFILRSVPAISGKINPKQLLTDIISEIQELGKSVQLEVKQEKILKIIACHSAIKAGDKLTVSEMNQLITDLYTTQNPTTCPHGRPTMIRIKEEELAKKFGR